MMTAGDDEHGPLAQVHPAVLEQARLPGRRLLLGLDLLGEGGLVGGGPSIVFSLIADPRVEHGVHQVDEEVGDQVDQHQQGHETDDTGRSRR